MFGVKKGTDRETNSARVGFAVWDACGQCQQCGLPVVSASSVGCLAVVRGQNCAFCNHYGNANENVIYVTLSALPRLLQLAQRNLYSITTEK